MTNFLALAELLETDWHWGYRTKTAQVLRHASLMQSVLLGDATCPCCEEQIKCASGCTFAKDAPNDAAKMAAVRAVLGASP